MFKFCLSLDTQLIIPRVAGCVSNLYKGRACIGCMIQPLQYGIDVGFDKLASFCKSIKKGLHYLLFLIRFL